MSWKEGLDETMRVVICDASDHTVQKLQGTRKATADSKARHQEASLSWPSCTLTEPQGRDLGRQQAYRRRLDQSLLRVSWPRFSTVTHSNAYRILVGEPGGKRPLGRPRRRQVDNIKMLKNLPTFYGTQSVHKSPPLVGVLGQRNSELPGLF
jgi:hypothetical protein